MASRRRTRRDRSIGPPKPKRPRRSLGVHVRLELGMPNRRLFDSFEARVALAKVFRRYRPRLVLGFGEKTPLASPDHFQAMQITDAGVFYARLTKWDQYFDNLPVHTITAYLYYTLAFTSFGVPPGAGNLVVDISDTLQTKLEAIRCYKTQFGAQPEKQIEERVQGVRRSIGHRGRISSRRDVFQPAIDRHPRPDALPIRAKAWRSARPARAASLKWFPSGENAPGSDETVRHVGHAAWSDSRRKRRRACGARPFRHGEYRRPIARCARPRNPASSSPV